MSAAVQKERLTRYSSTVRRTVRRTVRHVVSRQHVRGLAPEPVQSAAVRAEPEQGGDAVDAQSAPSARRAVQRGGFFVVVAAAVGVRARAQQVRQRVHAAVRRRHHQRRAAFAFERRALGARSDLRGAAKIVADIRREPVPELVHAHALVLDEPPRRGDVVGSRRGEDGGRAQGHRGSERVTNASSQKKRS